MQVTEFEFICEWCGRDFARRHPRGRRPLYCARVCRQRAYEERRRGAFVLGLPAPTMFERLHPDPKLYQAGMGGEYLHISHALRPDGCADNIGFRPSLCGARVNPTPRPFYSHRPISGRKTCGTCARVAEQFPLQRRIDPLSDIGTATSAHRHTTSDTPLPQAARLEQNLSVTQPLRAPAIRRQPHSALDNPAEPN